MLSINPSELIWTIINFFLMLFLLKHFLYTPVSEFMEKRQAKVDAGRAEERRAEEELNANRERLAAAKAESRRQAAQLLSDTQAQDGRRQRQGSGAGRPVRSGRGGAGGPQGRAFRPAHRPGSG